MSAGRCSALAATRIVALVLTLAAAPLGAQTTHRPQGRNRRRNPVRG